MNKFIKLSFVVALTLWGINAANAQTNAGAIGNSQSVCYNVTPATLVFITQPSNEDEDATFTYQWQVSTTGTVSSFSNVGSETGNSYHPAFIQGIRYYRVVVTSGGSSVNSNTVTVTGWTEFVAGTVSSAQTICYNTAPTQLTATNCSGGDGTFTYQWEISTNGTTFTNATGTGATSLNFTSPTLTQTTYFRLRYTSGSGCGTVYSNVIMVTVYPNIAAAIIGNNEIICYNIVPNAISITTAASGGNGNFSNQWQLLNGSTWTDIAGQTADSYQPLNLTVTTQYRLKNTSDYGCGTIYSNIITKMVYADIVAGAITGTQTICYNSAPTQFSFSTNPSGAGNSYTYQWQSSTTSSTTDFSNIPTATNSTYQAENLTQTTYYRVIVTSTNCLTSDTSNVSTITVLPEFITGEVAGEDTICQNIVPREITTIVNCSGADGNYSYQWQQSPDNFNFTDVLGATAQNYQSPALSQTTFYRLRFSSNYGCGVLYSNSIEVWVIPAPTEKTLIGEREICSNTYDLEYFFAQIEANIAYEWSITGGEITEQIDDNHIIVHWDNTAGNGTLTLKQTNLLTDCVLESDYMIVKTENAAPDKTNIVKKQNSNILICSENSPNAHYEWGFIDKSTDEVIIIPESNCQYIMLPHPMDITKYDYFVNTTFSYGGNASCFTQSRYSENAVQLAPKNAKLSFTLAPNPTKSQFSVSVLTEIKSDFSITVQNLYGQTVYTKQFAENIPTTSIPFNLNLPVGVYMVTVTAKDEVSTQKLVIK